MSLITELDREIATLESRLSALKLARYSLNGSSDSPPPAKTPQRAAFGLLKRSILTTLSPKNPLTNAEIREALLKNGYTHSLNPMHVSKTLQKLVKGKEAVATGKKPHLRYALPKEKENPRPR